MKEWWDGLGRWTKVGVIVLGVFALLAILPTPEESGGGSVDASELEDRIERLEQERDELAAELEAAGRAPASEVDTSVLEAAEARIDSLEERIVVLENEVAAQVDLREAAEEAAALAEQRATDLELAFDAELQAARVEFVAGLQPAVCGILEAADARLTFGQVVGQFTKGRPELAAAIEGFSPQELVDAAAIDSEIDRCWTEIEAAKEAAALQARLTEPKGNGFYTVGDEIAPGRWRSTGTGDGCYWERLDANQEIIDNHFGVAGGTVTIRATDYEVRFDDCGTWEYLG